jgi:excisionase family DNA binding protein
MDDDEIMTPADVANLLKLHVKSIYKLAKTGEIPGNRIGRSWRFFKSDIVRLVKHEAKAA